MLSTSGVRQLSDFDSSDLPLPLSPSCTGSALPFTGSATPLSVSTDLRPQHSDSTTPLFRLIQFHLWWKSRQKYSKSFATCPSIQGYHSSRVWELWGLLARSILGFELVRVWNRAKVKNVWKMSLIWLLLVFMVWYFWDERLFSNKENIPQGQIQLGVLFPFFLPSPRLNILLSVLFCSANLHNWVFLNRFDIFCNVALSYV